MNYAARNISSGDSSHIACLVKLSFTRPLAITAHNLDLIRRNSLLIIEFKGNILDQERPYFVTEAVCIEVALSQEPSSVTPPQILTVKGREREAYLERQPRPHMRSQNLGNVTIVIRENLHSQLGLDAAFIDEVIEGVC